LKVRYWAVQRLSDEEQVSGHPIPNNSDLCLRRLGVTRGGGFCFGRPDLIASCGRTQALNAVIPNAGTDKANAKRQPLFVTLPLGSEVYRARIRPRLGVRVH
jgi:hypothetical protein